MSLYNKYIYYELNNNNTFSKVEIDKNIVTCENKKIKKDIELKIQSLNIKYIVFFVSLYDYEIIKPTYYYKTIKHLNMEQMPIYKKKDDFTEFIKWYGTHFNNDKIDIYETEKFTKRKHVFRKC